MPKVQKIPVDAIRMDGNTQSRVRIDTEVVANYTEDRRNGVKHPPIDVYHDGSDYWPADGFHRTLAAVSAGENAIDARVHTGTQHDAMLHSAGANYSHGIQRTTEDKRHAVQMLLDAGVWEDRSVNWFASQCKVSFSLAKSVYDRWHKSKDKQAPTERVGLDGKTQPASKKQKPNTPPPEPSENPHKPPEPEPISPTDSVGREVPARYRKAHSWNTEASNVVRDLGAMVTRCRNLKGSAGGELFNFAEAERCLSQVQTELKFGKYHTECPECLDSEPNPKCDVCKGVGWINKGIFGRLSDVQKKALGCAPF